MTGEYAPAAILDAYHYLDDQAPELGLQLSGILGTSANGHTYGYHRSRNWCVRYGRDRAGDYSVQLAADRAGDGDAASALDVKPSTAAGMIVMTQRLIAALDRRDPRLRACREFYGTVNGRSVTGRDVPSGRVVTADATHLWHLHVSGLREYANDPDAWQAIADVIAGNPLEEEFTVNAQDEAKIRAIVREEVADQLGHIWDAKTGEQHGFDWIVETAISPLGAQLSEILRRLPAPTKAAAAKDPGR